MPRVNAAKDGDKPAKMQSQRTTTTKFLKMEVKDMATRKNATVNVCKVKMVKEPPLPYLQKEVMTAKDAAEIFCDFMKNDNAEEHFNILCLNVKGYPVGIHEVSHGTINATMVEPREVFKRALLNNARAIILNHNHPSGNTEPSSEDIVLTTRLKDAGQLLGVKVLDHIITGDNGDYYSFAGDDML